MIRLALYPHCESLVLQTWPLQWSMPELFPEAKWRKKMKASPEDNSGLRTLLTNPTVYVFFQRLLGGRGVGAFLATNFWNLKGGETVVDIGCASGFVLDYMPND